MLQNHVYLLSGKVHAGDGLGRNHSRRVPTACAELHDELVVGRDSKFKREVIRAFVKSMGLCLSRLGLPH